MIRPANSTELAQELHQWHDGQTDPIYQVGSLWAQDEEAPAHLIKDAIHNLESEENSEAHELAEQLNKLI